ncbi:ATP-dependent DNA ligase [Thermocladium modestius]|uniref:ATP-dependent DNA ligase n=1 Tax=Thermocladium modestius TaxID=62609 RepID=UPI0016673CA6|nr:ATP-dependent DNA ligase [Thermocladium modestius]
MPFSEVVKVFEAIEATTQRTVMAKLLSSIFKEAPPQAMDKVVYILLGQLRPDWEGVELGVGEKLAMRAISTASGLPFKKVEETYKKLGDLGEAARQVMSMKGASTILDYFGAKRSRALTVGEVYESLMNVAKASGEGAQDAKVRLLSSLFAAASPDEAKYIARFIVGKLRLGVADMTVLDSLSDVFNVPKESLEKAYHVHPDLGHIARLLAERGRDALAELRVTPGIPIQPMLAERLSSSKEILGKLGGIAICEYKYDGERAQIHRRGDSVRIFSRRLEDITHEYPDVVGYVMEAMESRDFVVEGEIVTVDPDTGEIKPFQELMHRKRKHDIKEAVEEYPVEVFLFDAIYMDGVDLTDLPLIDRKRALWGAMKPHPKVHHATWRLLDDPAETDKFFLEAISNDCEGIMCKSVKRDSIYELGARGWLWIKYKRDYKSELTDTLDLAVVGAFWGRGRRAGLYGALLLAAYDPDTDQFYTVAKVGSGFTDEDLKKLPEMLDQYKLPHKHPRVVSKMEPDVWFVPGLVIEVIGAEITQSPIHTCCMDPKAGTGLAIRFPRFTGRYRTDKSPEQATTVREVMEMFRNQKKIGEQSIDESI